MIPLAHQLDRGVRGLKRAFVGYKLLQALLAMGALLMTGGIIGLLIALYLYLQPMIGVPFALGVSALGATLIAGGIFCAVGARKEPPPPKTAAIDLPTVEILLAALAAGWSAGRPTS